MAGEFSSWTANLRRFIAPPPDPDAGEGDLEALGKLWPTIQNHIKGLEEREVLDESERLQLGELRDIALDAEDVLDAGKYEKLRDKVEEGGTRKRARGGEGSDQAARLLAAQAGEISRRFHRVKAEFGALHLRKGEGVPRRRPDDRAPSSSLVDERYVYDRDDSKNSLRDYMLSDYCASSDQPCVIPVVGMGLVGKTTIVQLIYNDPEVVKAFPSRGWVSLTSNHDLKKLLKSVVECLTLQPCCGDHQLDMIQGLLRQSLNGKRLLIVLDDVRREHLSFWKQFKASLSSDANRSVVLLTTKMGEVADMTKTVPAAFYMFRRSPDDSCWLTFKRYASDGQDSVDMEGVRQKVAEICDGMPSLAKLLGTCFRRAPDRKAWMDFLEDAVEDEILPALQSTYQLLPSHLKPCVLYCSLFPKGYLFNKVQLVRLWMSQGLILSKTQNCLEDIGIQYFDELISKSFFLQSETDEQAYFMPNIICDLVYSISRNGYSRVVDMHNLPQKSRHLSLVLHECRSVGSFFQYSGLRSFLVMRTLSITHNEIQDDMFLQPNHLRSLDLSYTNIDRLPDTIGNLKHLRFLALNHTLIKTLPESMHKLYNLQTLELKGCRHLQELPRGISSLINLRHLDVEEDSYYLLMPLQIRNLTSLQKLPRFNLKKGNEFCGMRELQDLANLRELGISGLCNVSNLDDAKKANMQGKEYLKILKLIWSSNDVSPISENFGDHVDQNFLNTADETDEEEEEKSEYHHKNERDLSDEQYSRREIQDEQESNFVQLRAGINNMDIQDSASSDATVSEEDSLESLRPFTTLERLCIQSYGGERFPDWIGDASFWSLMFVEFTDCKCVVLPSLGQLPKLKFLSIDGMPVELVGTNFCGTGNPKAFPELETLSFHNMNKWKIWDGVKEGDFPNLNKLCLFNCPELRRIPAFPNLNKLCLFNCPELRSVPAFFSSLKILEVSRCTKLTNIPELQSLEALQIHCCDALAALPTLVSLCSLTIMYCQKLKSLPLFPKLEKLWVENCEQLTSIVFCSCCPLSAGLSCRIADLKSVLVANCSQLCFSSKEPLADIQSSDIDGCLSLSWNKTQENND